MDIIFNRRVRRVSRERKGPQKTRKGTKKAIFCDFLRSFIDRQKSVLERIIQLQKRRLFVGIKVIQCGNKDVIKYVIGS
jgi:hypothetical protein